MKQTPIHHVHLQLKAKMGDFRGWQMPLQYVGTNEEYHAVRTAAGLFDVSHLGRIEVAGAGAPALLQKTFTRDVVKQPESSAAYGLFCSESGTIIADAVLFRLPTAGTGTEPRFLLTVSTETTEKVAEWLSRHASKDATITDRTVFTSQFALQGPASAGILEKLAAPHFKKIKLHSLREIPLAGTSVMISRTGYTGEDGYEFFVPADQVEAVWNLVLETGKDAGIMPCGLECRDILRLEMGYLLYGNDIDETRTPLEAGLASFIDFKKEFIGKDALLKLKAGGVKERLVGFALVQKAVPRSGGSIFSEDREIGVVTSGALSPAARSGIGLGYVLSRYAQPGQEVDIEVKDREIAAKIVEFPFYRKK
jgi:aminomethyltransferase